MDSLAWCQKKDNARLPRQKIKRLEWEYRDYDCTWRAQLGNYLWEVYIDHNGHFRGRRKDRLARESDAFESLISAKAWCQEQGDKLPVEQKELNDE